MIPVLPTPVFPRLPWHIEPYALLLGTTIEDAVQVKTPENYLFFASLKNYLKVGEEDIVNCVYNAANPTRAGVAEFKKKDITPLDGDKIYFDLPENSKKIILYVDDDFAKSRNGVSTWMTVAYLQKTCNGSVLGGTPDEILDIVLDLKEKERNIDFLICDHNLRWSATDRYPDFQKGPDFVKYLRSRDIYIPPIILHSDVSCEPFGWKQIPEYKEFIPKYDESWQKPHNERLADAINSIL